MATVKLTNVKKVYPYAPGEKKKHRWEKDAPTDTKVNLQLTEDGVVAVNDFNLEIKDKEFVVFVGPSGCGKSTTLRMIAGLEDISGGTLEIDGKVVNDLQPKDRGIAMVFQNYALYPHMTVYDNIAFSLRLQKMPEDQIYEKVTHAAEILGITDFLLRKPRALSGGQRQRVAIGRAMVRDSKVFLMDEPLSNLDAKLRNQMRAEIILLRQKLDTTFIYVTHDQTEAMTLGDRIVIMKDGRIQQVGTPTEVFEMPKNLFVAGFIGAPQMNIFRTELKKRGNEYFVEPFGVEIPVGEEKSRALRGHGVDGREIELGVRPEHIVLTKEGPGAIPCTLEVNEMLGSELHLHVYTEDGTRVIVRVPTIGLTTAERGALVAGKKVWITFEGKVIHFFDPETTENLLF